MTLEELKNGMPKHSRKFATQEVVDILNHLEGEEGEAFAEAYKQNFISHTRVMIGGEYTMKDYINAVKFVSYRMLQHPDIDAYQLTFPQRYNRLMEKWTAQGMTEEEIRSRKISPYVSAYKQNDLVAKITEQALIAPHILNAPMFQQALNEQMMIGLTARSEQVRSMALESVMKYTKAPEVAKFQVDVAISGGDEISAMRAEMHRLAGLQQASIESGSATTLEIAESRILHEVEEIIEVEADDA